jgi:hypothetical protein
MKIPDFVTTGANIHASKSSKRAGSAAGSSDGTFFCGAASLQPSVSALCAIDRGS